MNGVSCDIVSPSSSKTPIKKFSSHQSGVNSWKENSGVMGPAAYPILETLFKEEYRIINTN